MAETRDMADTQPTAQAFRDAAVLIAEWCTAALDAGDQTRLNDLELIERIVTHAATQCEALEAAQARIAALETDLRVKSSDSAEYKRRWQATESLESENRRICALAGAEHDRADKAEDQVATLTAGALMPLASAPHVQCPACDGWDTKVIDSRGGSFLGLWRRRRCTFCGGRFTTREVVVESSKRRRSPQPVAVLKP